MAVSSIFVTWSSRTKGLLLCVAEARIQGQSRGLVVEEQQTTCNSSTPVTFFFFFFQPSSVAVSFQRCFVQGAGLFFALPDWSAFILNPDEHRYDCWGKKMYARRLAGCLPGIFCFQRHRSKWDSVVSPGLLPWRTAGNFFLLMLSDGIEVLFFDGWVFNGESGRNFFFCSLQLSIDRNQSFFAGNF